MFLVTLSVLALVTAASGCEQHEAGQWPATKGQLIDQIKTAKLNSGSVTIDQAEKQLVTNGRLGNPVVAPAASDDFSALQGWSGQIVVYTPGVMPSSCEGQADAQACWGKVVYQTFCSACHSIDGNKGAAPTWKDLYGHEVKLADGSTVVADDAYIRQSIGDPGAKVVEGFAPMAPISAIGPGAPEIDAVIAFIKTLH
ncbi:MAG: cytochrome c [Polyangiales bacterium]